MATPMGPLPVVTSGTACFLLMRSRIDAVPPPLLATTARPNRGVMATPEGLLPVARGKKVPKFGLSTNLSNRPEDKNVGSCGAMSITETLLQPLLVTTAVGAKPPRPSWSAIATDAGFVGMGL